MKGARRQLWLIASAVLADRTEADDVVQESAIVGMGKLGEFARGTGFEAWMGQIVRNIARNTLRKRQRRSSILTQTARERTDRVFGREGAGPGFDAVLGEGLQTLDETARVCLLLRVVGELPYSTIATIAGVPEGTAMSHVHRARERLRAWMLERSAETDQGGTKA